MRSIQDDLSQDISDTLDRILGCDVYEDEKQDLLNSILDLFVQQEEDIKETLLTNENPGNRMFLPNNSSDFNKPSINLYILNPSMNPNTSANPYIAQSNFNLQPLMPPQLPFNSYYYNNQQTLYPNIQPQSYPQPTFGYLLPNYNGQSQIAFEENKKKSHDKKSKHHDGKSKSKSKKSKDKKDSKSKSKKSKDSKFNIETFVLQNSRDFNGIINYLTTKTGGNINDNGTIEVTSNSINRPTSHPKNLLQENDNYVAESSEKNAWILFDFKKMKVEITDYTIKASSTCCMKNWVFEISDDGSKWTIVDEHRNCNDLKTPNTVRSFKVQNSRFSRYCRIRHNGEFIDYCRGNVMIINRVEFYGKLKSQF